MIIDEMMKITNNNNKSTHNIKILGIGSSKYQQLTHNLFMVIQELGINVEIEQYGEVDDFIRFNIVKIPSLIIDGKVISKDQVPNITTLKSFLLPKTTV